MKRKIVLLSFVSILLFSLIPNNVQAQTMVNPFEVYDIMYWETGAHFLVNEYEIMTEANSIDPSAIYHISENLWNGDFTTNGFMDMLGRHG